MKLKPKRSGVLQIVFAPKSDSLAVVADHLIQICSVKDRTLVDRLEVPAKGLYSVAISRDGKYLVNAAADCEIRVRERTSSKRLC